MASPPQDLGDPKRAELAFKAKLPYASRHADLYEGFMAGFHSALTPEQIKAIKAWCNNYSAKLDRIEAQMKAGKRIEDYSPAEQDLFEAFGCRTFEV
jgi:hypothetical protein